MTSAANAYVRMFRAAFLVDTSGAEVEHRVLVELPDRGGMVALHVVREDLQARRAVDEGLVRQEQVLVRLSRDRLLRILADVDVPVEHAPRPAAQDPAIE